MKIISWNVNGLRACSKKGFSDWLKICDAHIVGLQEVRALPDQLEESVRAPEGWKTHFSPAERKGYSGVGLYSKKEPDEIVSELGESRFDIEGRFQLARFGKLWVANIYFPNGNGKERDNSRIPYKLEFYSKVFDFLEPLKKKNERIVVMGDYNTAHQAIDLARPKDNEKTSGFCIEEREELTRWIDAGWVDAFRESAPNEAGHYTWWSQRAGARGRNVGWRIDYFFISPGLRPHFKICRHYPEVLGSDHCPLELELKGSVMS